MLDKITGDRYYHVYNLANGMINIFKEQRNYPFFLSKVEKHITSACEFLAYCLMKNHFHLVIKTKEVADQNISRAFANLFIGYAKAFNKTYNRSGSLFKELFRRKLIEHENYLKNVILYIHINPVKDGFVDQVIECPWTSYHDIIGTDHTFINREFALDLLDDAEDFKAAIIKAQVHSFIPTFTHD